MKLSARNMLKGKVTAIEEGMITAKVKITLAGGETITSIVSKESVAELELMIGDEAYAVIKSTEVMIAK
jgi:molybdopterin-binding protein